MDLDFIEIGTSDFEALALETGPGSAGISVEPVREYLDRLPDREGLVKVLAAVSDRRGDGVVYRLPPSRILELGLPRDVRGCNCLGAPHPTVLGILARRFGEREALRLFEAEPVEVVTPGDLLERHGVRSVGLLKVDTEGHDCRILNAYLDAAGPGQLPRLLRFESNCLTPRADVDATVARWRERGFAVDDELSRRSRARPGYEETFMRREW